MKITGQFIDGSLIDKPLSYMAAPGCILDGLKITMTEGKDVQKIVQQSDIGEVILNLVMKIFGIEERDLFIISRKTHCVKPRQIAMYLIKKYTYLSLGQIGYICGGKDHATVVHSKKTVMDLCDTDKQYREDLENIENAVKEVLKAEKYRRYLKVII